MVVGTVRAAEQTGQADRVVDKTGRDVLVRSRHMGVGSNRTAKANEKIKVRNV